MDSPSPGSYQLAPTEHGTALHLEWNGDEGVRVATGQACNSQGNVPVWLMGRCSVLSQRVSTAVCCHALAFLVSLTPPAHYSSPGREVPSPEEKRHSLKGMCFLASRSARPGFGSETPSCQTIPANSLAVRGWKRKGQGSYRSPCPLRRAFSLWRPDLAHSRELKKRHIQKTGLQTPHGQSN